MLEVLRTPDAVEVSAKQFITRVRQLEGDAELRLPVMAQAVEHEWDTGTRSRFARVLESLSDAAS